MTPSQEMDLRSAAKAVGCSIAEIVFVTVHAEMCGPHRQEQAVQTFAEVLVDFVKRAADTGREQ